MSTSAQWLSLGLNALIFLAVAGGIFVFFATMISQNFGSKTIWPMVAVYVPLMPLAVAYRMGGLRNGFSFGTSVGTLYYLGLMLAMIGVPLVLGAMVLKRLCEQRPQKAVGLQMATSWGVCMAAMPVGLAASVIVNALYTFALTF